MANEKRRDLIDRNRLLRDIYFQEGRYPESHLLRMAIREQPKVDAVEVVRCKDCKHWKRCYKLSNPKEPSYCGSCGKIDMDVYMNEDDFCSYGERRDNG